MKTKLFLFGTYLLLFAQACVTSNSRSPEVLKDALKNKFLVGTAMNVAQLNGRDTAGIRIIKQHFNSIVAENCMKSEIIQPEQGKFNFRDADAFVDFGIQNKMIIIGHTLVWHSQTPEWFFKDKDGNNVSRDTLIQRMKGHIFTVMNRYKEKIHGWDVVNEAIEDDGSLRKSLFLKIIGEDYIELAFRFAREADSKAELHYNDYNMTGENKRKAVVNMVNDLKSKGIKIDGIGMQGHLMMDFPSVEEFEKSIVSFAGTGAKVMITELDLSALPNPYSKLGAEISLRADYQEKMNPYKDGLPDSIAIAQQKRYADFFRMFIKHSDKISRVTLWGVSDGDSWKDDWPIKGRTDFPLLFGRNHRPKLIVSEIIKMVKENSERKNKLSIEY
jgi:endo-1,4-beta-xylanase